MLFQLSRGNFKICIYVYQGYSKQHFFLKSEAVNDFSRCISPKNDIDHVSPKNFGV